MEKKNLKASTNDVPRLSLAVALIEQLAPVHLINQWQMKSLGAHTLWGLRNLINRIPRISYGDLFSSISNCTMWGSHMPMEAFLKPVIYLRLVLLDG